MFDSPSASSSQDALTVEISYQRKAAKGEKQQPVRALLPAHLPRQEEVIEPKGLEEDMKKIGQEVTEILEHVPDKLYVRRIVRPKYVKDKQDGVYIGPLPSLPLPKSNAGPSLLAHILVSKFVDHLPYHRQIQIFKREYPMQFYLQWLVPCYFHAAGAPLAVPARASTGTRLPASR